MPKKMKPQTFDEALSKLRSLHFDVQETGGVANGVRVSKHGCAAVIGRAKDGKGIILIHKPGIVMGGEIAVLLDRGFQKFFKTSKFEMAATAERLTVEYRFTEELDEVIGEVSLYNESLGTVSDEYMYDRLKGRNKDAPPKGAAPWSTGETATGTELS